MNENCDETPRTLEERAADPKRVEGDYGAITEQDLEQQIELDKYLNSKQQGKKVIRSIYGQRYQPPSARGF